MAMLNNQMVILMIFLCPQNRPKKTEPVPLASNDSTHGHVSNYQSPPSTDSCNTAGEQLSLSRSEWAIKSVAQTIPSCCSLEWSISSIAAIPGCHFPFKSYALKWDKMRGTGHNWPQLWLVPRCFQTRSFRSVAQEQVRVTGVLGSCTAKNPLYAAGKSSINRGLVRENHRTMGDFQLLCWRGTSLWTFTHLKAQSSGFWSTLHLHWGQQIPFFVMKSWFFSLVNDHFSGEA